MRISIPLDLMLRVYFSFSWAFLFIIVLVPSEFFHDSNSQVTWIVKLGKTVELRQDKGMNLVISILIDIIVMFSYVIPVVILFVHMDNQHLTRLHNNLTNLERPFKDGDSVKVSNILLRGVMGIFTVLIQVYCYLYEQLACDNHVRGHNFRLTYFKRLFRR